MCGRFVQKTSFSELKKIFGVTEDAVKLSSEARYNVAPTQGILNIRQTEDGREAVLMKWGLVPAWAKDPAIAAKLINARSETVESKPSFRDAFKRHRSLIPAAGFYEWSKISAGRKQPFYFQMKDEHMFAFAGLWESWKDVNGHTLETCTILTTEANSLLAKIHDRMPCIIHQENFDLWLGGEDNDDSNGDPRRQKERLELLRPYPAKEMKSHPVSATINSPSQQGANLLDPVPINSL